MKTKLLVLGLLLALLMALPMSGFTEAMPAPVTMSLEWTDEMGGVQSAPAAPVSYPGYENCFWVQVPPEALFSLTLRIADPTGVYASFSMGDGSLLGPVMDAGTGLTEATPVEIMCFTADGQPGALLRLYVSTLAPMPEDPSAAAPVVQPVDVPVYYRSYDGLSVAMDASVHLEEGVHDVYADPQGLLENYELDGSNVQQVTVDANGANPSSVTFYYNYIPPVVNPVEVWVYYKDYEGQDVATPTSVTVEEGTHDVYAEPTDLKENYVLDGSNVQQVTVDANGANPSSVTFYYNYVPPVVNPVEVWVYYKDTEGQDVATPTSVMVEEGTHDVYAQPFDLKENYVLEGSDVQQVTVDANGANPSSVTFYYNYVPPVVNPVEVWVYYKDTEGQDVATPTSVMVEEGTHDVYAQPFDLKENYVLDGSDVQQVTVDANGANPSSVTFYYNYVPPVVNPVEVWVYYRDYEGQDVATPTTQWVEEGTHDVYAEPADLKENYALDGSNVQQVTVDINGANPSFVTFYYTYNEPAPVTGVIRVRLLEAGTEAELYAYDQEVFLGTVNTIEANLTMLPAQYAPMGETRMDVYVDENGAANPEAVFYFVDTTPTDAPTEIPTESPTEIPTEIPTEMPTEIPTDAPTEMPPVLVPIRYLDEENGLPVATDGQAECLPGQVTTVYANPQDLLEGYELAVEGQMNIAVDAQGVADPAEAVFYYRLAQAQPPVIAPREIDVWYLFTDETQAASPTVFTCQPGENTVYPEPADLPEGSVLTGADHYTVTLDEYGLSAEYVTFHYERPQAAPTVSPAMVRVRYLLQDGTPIAADQNIMVGPGDVPVAANPEGLPEGYVLEGGDTQMVHVDENGANPAEIIFYYREAVPAMKVALVPVKYYRPDGVNVFYNDTITCVQGSENVISVDWNIVAQNGGENYTVPGGDSVSVTVDENGAATPAEVNFFFAVPETPTDAPTDVPAVTEPVKITVFYVTDMGVDVAASQEKDCYIGNNVIEATPVNLQPNYVLVGENTQNVVLSADGTLTPDIVVFNYAYVPTASPLPPTPSPLPYEYEPMDGYCYPKNDGMNFRTGPSTSGTEVLRTLKKSDLAHIIGQTRNDEGQTWYVAEVDGQQGFMLSTLVRVLTDEEVAALFGYTAPPTTPPPTPIPDGVAIERWAYTNAKVNFRREPSTKGNTLINELSRNTAVWVYSASTVDNAQWYSVLVNGTPGYLMAEFVDVCSQEESDAMQSLLASPMPTSSPSPAPVTDTPAPTDLPTPTPTAVVTGTPVPESYKGYALTRWQVALRPGVSDEAILEWLTVDRLVYVSGQTYVDGVAWSSVQAVESGNYGFVIDEALMRITNEEAKRYLDAMQPAATETPEPAQQYGFAMTLGDGVPFRAFPDQVGEIYTLLPYSTVVSVQGQVYTGDIVWHVVQYNGLWGYVRQDQLRMLSEDETVAYLQSLESATPTPTPAPTPEPPTQNSLSSYGYVQSTSGRVNLRSEPSTSSTRLRLLDSYAFALVMGTVQNEEGIWYHVSQAGTVGYISGDYFKVLTISELSDFLQSDEYRNANDAPSSTGSGSGTGQIQPVEDYNQGVWQNPALNASYEPFNPYLTPTPNPEQLPTASPSPTPTLEPTATPEIGQLGPGTVATPEPEQTRTGGSAWPWLLLSLAAIGGGGAYYAYTIHRKNERRRQTVRAQQARQARNAAQQPQMRAAANNPGGRPYPNQQAAPFMPPRSGAPGTGMNGQPGPTPTRQETGAYRPPVRQPQDQAAPNRPAAQPQGTQAYRPMNGQEHQESDGTQVYSAFRKPVDQQTTAGRTAQNAAPRPAQSTVPARPTAQNQPAMQQNPPVSDRFVSQTESQPETYHRQRRSDRHKNENDEG